MFRNRGGYRERQGSAERDGHGKMRFSKKLNSLIWLHWSLVVPHRSSSLHLGLWLDPLTWVPCVGSTES